MVLSLNANFERAMSAANVEPVVLAEIENSSIAYLQVLTFSVGAGDGVTVRRLSVTGATDTPIGTVTEGSEFVLGADNNATATNIAAALDLLLSGGGVRAHAQGPYVIVVDDPAFSTSFLRMTSTDDAAWTSTVESTFPQTRFVSGDVAFDKTLAGSSFQVPIGLDTIGAVSRTLNPFTRKFALASVEVIFTRDGSFDDYVTNHYPIGKKITLSLGTKDLAITDFEKLGTFIIDTLTPSEDSWSLTCVEPLLYQLQDDVQGHFVMMHPLVVIRNLLNQIGFPTGFLDTASLLPSNNLTISHFTLSRFSHRQVPALSFGVPIFTAGVAAEFYSPGLNDPEKAAPLVDDMLNLLRGSLVPDRDGVYSYTTFDRSASVVRTLGEDDYAEVIYGDLFEDLTSSVDFIADTAAFIANNILGKKALYTYSSPLSERLFGTRADGKGYRKEIETKWLGSQGWLVDDLLAGDETASTTIEVGAAPVLGFSGARVNADAPAITQDADAVPSSTRLVYLLLVGEPTSASTIPFEIIECDGGVPVLPSGGPTRYPTGIQNEFYFQDPNNLTEVVANYRYDIATRGAFGTDLGGGHPAGEGPAWGGSGPGIFASNAQTFVFDITQFIHVARDLINGFQFGAPAAKMRTDYRQADLEEGDFISFVDSRYVRQLKRGADASVVWEIIGKEVDPLGDSPGITFSLRWVRDDVAPITLLESLPFVPPQAVPLLPSVLVTPTDPVTDSTGLVVTTTGGQTVFKG